MPINSAASPARKPRGPFFVWTLALAAVLFILLHESLIGGRGLVPADGVLNRPPWNQTERSSNYLLGDQYSTFIPQHEFVHQEILHGHFPLWDPYLECGKPNLGSIQGALLFPINLLLMPLDPFYASGPAAFLKLFLAGLFTMLYLRLLGATDGAAFLSGLVFSLSGFMIVWLGHPQVNCAMWLPLLLYFIEKSFPTLPGQPANAFSGATLRAWSGLAITYGLMLLGGHPPTMIHITILAGVYFFFRWTSYRQAQPFCRLGMFVGSLAIGFLLAAPQLLPYLEYYHDSSTSMVSAALHRWAATLTPGSLLFFLFPHLAGSPTEGFEDMAKVLGLEHLPNFNERTGYVGILPLLLATWAIAFRRCKFTWFYMFIIIASLLVIFGVPPLPALMSKLPLLGDINQTRLLLFVGFGIAILAGFGWDTFSRNRDRRKVHLVTMAFWVVAGLATLWVWSGIEPKFHELDASYRTFVLKQFLVLAGGMVATGALVLCSGRGGNWLLPAICLGWTAFDLLWFGRGCNPAIPREHYYPSTAGIEWLRTDHSVFRILGAGTTLVPNSAEVYGLSDVRGLDFMAVQRYEELITGKSGDFNFYYSAGSLPDALPLLNVKYLLLPRPMRLNPQFFELVYSDGMAIFRYTACQPRALAVFNTRVSDPASILNAVRSGRFDPQEVLLLEEPPAAMAGTETNMAETNPNSSVRFTSCQADEVGIEASLPRPGFLLLLDTYFPGWIATVNGQPTKIYRADYNFRAVPLPAGESTVHFFYQPNSLRLGLALSATGGLVLIGAWLWSRKRPPVERQ